MWSIVEVLPELIEHETFQPLVDYLGNDPERGAEPIIDAKDLAEQLDTLITRKELGLSRQVADLFDRYITYRADWAVQWSQGKAASDPAMGKNNPCPWQPLLWKKIEGKLGAQQAHVATRLTKLGQLSPEEAKKRLGYSRLSIFGTPSVPKSYLQILAELSKLIDVHLYMLCPSNKYWADLKNSREKAKQHINDRVEFSSVLRQEIPEGHPLLLSLGRVARDFQTVLLELPNQDQMNEDGKHSLKGNHIEEVDAFVDPIGAEEHRLEQQKQLLEQYPNKAKAIGSVQAMPSALACIQSDIFHLRHPKALQDTRSLAPNDDSIQIHSCHSPTRQVEVLKESIFHLLNRHGHLEPRDIVVMTPDIETYAPLIRAIFDEGRDSPDQEGNWGPIGGPQLPYRLADLSLRRLNPVADALMRILELATDRVEASTIIDLLSLEPVQRKFNIEPEELSTIQTWIDESGIRWGIDAEHRTSQYNQPTDVGNTWQFGLEKLALGVTMADEGFALPTTDASIDDSKLARTVIPFDDMEGQNTKLLGNFMEFTAALFEQVELIQEACSIEAWVERLKYTIAAMTDTTQNASFLTRRVLDVVNTLKSDAEYSNFKANISLNALKNYLDGRFEVEATRQSQKGGAITFGGLLAVRSIPHKVVMLLGMDDGAFPRNPSVPRFDLTSHRPRVGDRDPRDEDRMLLLEAFMSAREHFMVFYSGRNVRSNDHQEPATPICELFDVLNQTFKDPDEKTKPVDWLTTEHPLQPFSPDNFVPEPRAQNPQPHKGQPGLSAWSFNKNQLEASNTLISAVKKSPQFFSSTSSMNTQAADHIPLDQFMRFIRQPVRSLFKNKEGLNLNLDDYSSVLADREPINLNNLETWGLTDDLLQSLIEEPTTSLSQVLNTMRAKGDLPLGTPGRLEFESSLRIAKLGLGIFQEITQDKTLCEPIPVDIVLPGTSSHLIGQLTDCWDTSLVYLYNGRESPKRLLFPWMSYLVGTANNPNQVENAHLILCYYDTKKKKEATEHHIFQLPGTPEERQAYAMNALESLHEIYSDAINHPIKLVEKASYKFSKMLDRSKGDLEISAERFAPSNTPNLTPAETELIEKAITEASKTWAAYDNVTNQTSGECVDPHLSLTWSINELLEPQKNNQSFDQEFVWRALTLWQPVFEFKAEV
jgi:exodeoxyribonuclease V gamma subunit